MKRVKIVMQHHAKGSDETERGINLPVKHYEKDKEYEVCENLAKCFVESGVAQHADSSAKKAKADEKHESKKLQGAPENKAQ